MFIRGNNSQIKGYYSGKSNNIFSVNNIKKKVSYSREKIIIFFGVNNSQKNLLFTRKKIILSRELSPQENLLFTRKNNIIFGRE